MLMPDCQNFFLIILYFVNLPLCKIRSFVRNFGRLFGRGEKNAESVMSFVNIMSEI